MPLICAALSTRPRGKNFAFCGFLEVPIHFSIWMATLSYTSVNLCCHWQRTETSTMGCTAQSGIAAWIRLISISMDGLSLECAWAGVKPLQDFLRVYQHLPHLFFCLKNCHLTIARAPLTSHFSHSYLVKVSECLQLYHKVSFSKVAWWKQSETEKSTFSLEGVLMPINTKAT